MKAKLFSIFLLICATVLYPQSNVRNEIQIIVNEIEKDNILCNSKVGYAEVELDQWKRYKNLSELATSKELYILINHQNGVVKCYAFRALVARKDEKCFKILLSSLIDNSKISTQYGCVGQTSMVGDELINLVIPDIYDDDGHLISSPDAQIISREQWKIINKELLFNKNIKLQSRSRLLLNIKPTPELYKRIKEIALSGEEPSAIVALAKYKKNQDTDIIIKSLLNKNLKIHAIYSIIIFPHENLYQSLENIFEEEWNKKLYHYQLWRLLYQALAQYPTKRTLKIFKKTLNTKDSFRYKTLCTFMYIAIKKHYNPIYKDILNQIYLDKYSLDEVESWLTNKYQEIL